jgi:uncharacterized protein involved in outer membrane biogenesis
MKRLLKGLLLVVGLLLLLVLVLVLSLDRILKPILERQLTKATGLQAKIGRLDIGLGTPRFNLEQVTLTSSADFGGTRFALIQEIHIQYDFQRLRTREVRLTVLRLDLAEMHLVKNAQGRANWDGPLKAMNALSTPHKDRPSAQEWLYTGIDSLNLSLGRVRYSDLGQPSNSFDLNLGLRDRVFSQVKSPTDMLGLVFEIFLRSRGGSMTTPAGTAPAPANRAR